MKSNLVSENCPPENSPLWKYLLMNISPMKDLPVKITPPPLRNVPLRKLSPYENPPPWENYPLPPSWNLLSTNKSYKWKKKNQITKFLVLKKAVQHNILIQNNQGPLRYTDNLIENTRLRYFLYRMKNTQKKNKSKNC